MLGIGSATRIYLAVGVTDLRKGFNGLQALARHVIGVDPLCGCLFLFCNRRRDTVKVLYWDGSGLWVCAKRLEKGTFHWPRLIEGESSVELSQTQLHLLLGGLDLRSVKQRGWFRKAVENE